MGTPQTFLMASLPTLFIDEGVIRASCRTCAASRPISTRLEPVLALRGFDHWFLLTYTFPPCLPDPSRLVVPTRPVVVRAAPTLPCVPGSGCPQLQQAATTARRRGPFIPSRQTAPRGARSASNRPPCFPSRHACSQPSSANRLAPADRRSSCRRYGPPCAGPCRSRGRPGTPPRSACG